MPYDGPSIFRVPYGNDAALENFQNTVLDGVPADRVRRHADDPPTDDGVVRLWGTKSTNESTWTSVEAGDYLIFYRDGSYTHAARILRTERNDDLAREIWPNFEDEPWSLLLYLDEPSEIDVPSADVHDLAGYGMDHTMGFSPLNDMGTGGIRGKYGSVEAFAEGRRDGALRDGREGTDSQRDNRRLDDRAFEDRQLGAEAIHAVPEYDIDESVLDGLYFPDDRDEELLEQVESAFAAGKHVVFTGPPGTGKTELARRICASLAAEHAEIFSDYQVTTATADWSTFETVGGYMPTETDNDDDLTFEPGQVLRRFKQNDEQQNELLVIDEINRADIDKAFGQLFTLLSGQSVQLPYRRDGREIEIRHGTESTAAPAPHEYVVPASWRLVATMNTYDKTSLYELSYAFMRRFSFVHVDAPTIPAEDEEAVELLREYADVWGLDPDDETATALAGIWRALNRGDSVRKIGPAIVRDILRGIEHGPRRIEDSPQRYRERAITAAVGNYVLPQLEGSQQRRQTIEALARVDGVDRTRLGQLASDVLQVSIDG